MVVIGDEILGGKCVDTNSPWIAKRCRTLGLDLCRVVVVPDDVGLIAEEVARCAARFDHVFTSGGVGPTHDDMTMLGVAEAMGVGLKRHPELTALLHKKMPAGPTAAALRMADIPDGAELWWDGDLFFPVVVMGNICIFPGVPSLLRRKFDEIAHRFEGVPIMGRSLCTEERESVIAERLQVASERWPGVAIGSYPQFATRPHTVTITLDSRDRQALEDCWSHLSSAIE
jgi:molybdenum cofactor synthesis domain-containing protein